LKEIFGQKVRHSIAVRLLYVMYQNRLTGYTFVR